MRIVLCAAFLLAGPAFAGDVSGQPATVAIAHAGQMLRDASNNRIGTVQSVEADGSVGLILNSRYIVMPAASLSASDGKLVTSMTRKEVGAL